MANEGKQLPPVLQVPGHDRLERNVKTDYDRKLRQLRNERYALRHGLWKGQNGKKALAIDGRKYRRTAA